MRRTLRVMKSPYHDKNGNSYYDGNKVYPSSGFRLFLHEIVYERGTWWVKMGGFWIDQSSRYIKITHQNMMNWQIADDTCKLK